MICTCGHENVDGAQFCESCQKYLGWQKEQGVAGEQTQAAAQKPAVATVAREAPAPPAEAESPPAEAGALHADAPPLPPPLPPAAIPPDREFEPPERRIPEPPKEPEPGELICDQCGSGNRAIANFCRRCGASLANAQVAKRPSWWRRLLSWRRRTYLAGERRHRQTWRPKTTAERVRRGVFQASRLVGVLAVLGLVSFGAWRGDVVHRVKHAVHGARVALFPHYEPVIPKWSHASSHLRGHPAKRAFDLSKNSFWAEGNPRNNGRGERLVVHFGRTVSIARVGIYAGDQKTKQSLVNEPVPHKVRIRFFDRHGRRVAGKVIFLAQTANFQKFSIDAKHATKAALRILSVYPSQKGHDAALSDVEFFEKT